MEKYGFIYVWYDKKRKMFYVGSHWGTEDDGYICSSNRMRDAYRRRPDDFKRRVIQKNIGRNDLLDEEHKWLKLIPENELGKRYYNLRQHKWGHWSTDENRRLTVGQKISLHHASPEFRRMASEAKMGDKNPMKRPEVAKKAGESKIGLEPWNKGKVGVQKSTRKGKQYGPLSDEHRAKLSEMRKGKIPLKIECAGCKKVMPAPHFKRYNHGDLCRAED